MSDTEILQKLKEQLEADAKKYMAMDEPYYSVGYYATQIMLAINVLEGKKHSVKTYKDDFFEKFPKAYKNKDDTPCYCVNSLYGTEFPCGYDCKDCWNQVYKEEEE